MKKYYALFAAVLLLAGCAFSTQMVNDKGQKVECTSGGVGPISGAMAAGTRDACVSKYKAQGYHEVQTP